MEVRQYLVLRIGESAVSTSRQEADRPLLMIFFKFLSSVSMKIFYRQRKSSAHQSLENCSGLSIPVSTHEEKPKITAYCHDVTLCNQKIKKRTT